VAPRVALGMLARSDPDSEPLLPRILSIVSDSFDGVEILRDEGKRITHYGAQRNRLIELAERKGYDWVFMLDSDECMFPEDIAKVRLLMTPDRRLIILPRYEFVKDFDHYDPRGYPDYQGRVFRLGVGYRYRHSVHEGLYRRFAVMSEMRLRHGYFSDETPIYHYGRVRSPEELALKFHNYDLIARGKTPVDTVPDEMVGLDHTHRWGHVVRFDKPHPLMGQ
jgi:hypothetical protein